MRCGTANDMTTKRGRHPDRALTAVQVRQIKTPGRHADGGGLYLFVEPSGAKRWVLRTIVQGRRRDIGLGSVSLVSLVAAREIAAAYRKTARAGGDPIKEHRKTVVVVPTFEEAARMVHAEHSRAWQNQKHVAQWLTTLSRYAFPFFGNRPIDQIGTADVLRALTPIWLSKADTARRVRRRIGVVLDWAKAAGHRTGDNPVDGLLRVLAHQNVTDNHHAALPYADVPAFVRALGESDIAEIPKLALEFLILTAARTGEVLGMCWTEIDMANGTWTIPRARMKTRREHRVPLVPRALAIIRRAKELSADTELVFPGRSYRRPLANMTFLKALERMNMAVTAHGFRSSFRDWAAEQTNFPREVCEKALGHAIGNKVEAAYRRGDLLEKRRELMAAWADYINMPVLQTRELAAAR